MHDVIVCIIHVPKLCDKYFIFFLIKKKLALPCSTAGHFSLQASVIWACMVHRAGAGACSPFWCLVTGTKKDK